MKNIKERKTNDGKKLKQISKKLKTGLSKNFIKLV